MGSSPLYKLAGKKTTYVYSGRCRWTQVCTHRCLSDPLLGVEGRWKNFRGNFHGDLWAFELFKICTFEIVFNSVDLYFLVEEDVPGTGGIVDRRRQGRRGGGGHGRVK